MRLYITCIRATDATGFDLHAVIIDQDGKAKVAIDEPKKTTKDSVAVWNDCLEKKDQRDVLQTLLSVFRVLLQLQRYQHRDAIMEQLRTVHIDIGDLLYNLGIETYLDPMSDYIDLLWSLGIEKYLELLPKSAKIAFNQILNYLNLPETLGTMDETTIHKALFVDYHTNPYGKMNADWEMHTPWSVYCEEEWSCEDWFKDTEYYKERKAHLNALGV